MDDILKRCEIEMIQHIADGLTSKEIAGKMKYRDTSVETMRTHIHRKLGVRSAAHLVSVCYQNGLLKVKPEQ